MNHASCEKWFLNVAFSVIVVKCPVCLRMRFLRFFRCPVCLRIWTNLIYWRHILTQWANIFPSLQVEVRRCQLPSWTVCMHLTQTQHSTIPMIFLIKSPPRFNRMLLKTLTTTQRPMRRIIQQVICCHPRPHLSPQVHSATEISPRSIIPLRQRPPQPPQQQQHRLVKKASVHPESWNGSRNVSNNVVSSWALHKLTWAELWRISNCRVLVRWVSLPYVGLNH